MVETESKAGSGPPSQSESPRSQPRRSFLGWVVRWLPWAVLGFVLAGSTSVLVPAIRRPVFQWLGQSLDVGVVPDPATAIMILNGDINTRPLKAAQLYRQGLAPRVLYTRVRRRKEASIGSLPIEEQMKSMLIQCGVAQDDIEILDRVCVSTFDEAQTANDWLESHPGSTLIVVTNNYHTRRSRWVYQQCVPIERIQFVSAATDGYGPNDWWRNQDGFSLYLAEYLKFPLYLFLYGYGWILIPSMIAAGWGCYRMATRRSSNPSD